MDLTRLQIALEDIYQVFPGISIEDYLITDIALANSLDNSKNPRDIDEKLMVYEEEDQLLMSLYLNPDLLTRLQRDDPTRLLHDGNLSDLCLAVEGVSHFLYLAWNAGQDKSVTALELEMQAEIDKFVTISQLLRQQGHNHSHRLHSWLFKEVQYDKNLTANEQRRYRLANEMAARYCKQLETDFLDHSYQFGAGLYADLRRFYRLTYQKKLDHLDNAHPQSYST